MKLNYLPLNQFSRKISLFMGIILFLGLQNLQANDFAFAYENEQTTVLKVSGTVTSADDGEPLIGATVIVKGTSNGTTTDLDGFYEIDAEPTDVLSVSYTGMKSQEVIIGGRTTINIVLQGANVMDEVVVIGYGTQKKSHLTGSISKVENKNLDQIAVARVDDALIGQVSGVNIQASSAEAGAAPTITIRISTKII